MAGRQSDELSISKPSTAEKSPSTLLAIPGELRNRIYELSLLQDNKVYPFDYKPCGCDCPKHKRHAPAVALLRVNRQINREATPLLYSRVQFRLSTGYVFMKFMALGEVCMYGSPSAGEMYPSRHLIRSLRIKFVPEHMPTEVRSGHVLDCWADPGFQLLSKKQRARAIHRYNRDVCEAVWTNAGKVVTLMRDLKSFSMDLEQAFCPLGCCRMVGHVLKSLKGLKKKGGFTITVSGELKNQERQMILGGLQYSGPAGDDGSVQGPLVHGEDGDEVEDEAEHQEQHEDEDEEDEESDESDEDYDEEDDEEDEDEEYESFDEEDDAAGISSTVAVVSHSSHSEDGMGKRETDDFELEESSSLFHSESRESQSWNRLAPA
ncbi:hypothetical protein MMC07_003580 [Pseudocyphellaria aurata]|nr:hypothetical protein [Pseudocyphellaria aurata]